MRKIQNIISTFGNVIVREGNQLVVRIESLRSLCASSVIALYSYASALASWLGTDAWQGPQTAWNKPRLVTANCLMTVIKSVVKQDQRRHQITCHRAAA